MTHMLEPSEAVLRKTLDSIDRRKSVTRVIAVIFFVATVSIIVGMFSVVGIRKPTPSPDAFQLEFVSAVLGLLFWIGGIGVGIIAISYRNTHALLKAIALLSESGKVGS